jgi:crossover junction endodeoxyribonuclease RusA
MMTLTLPWPPSTNHFQGQKCGKRFLSAKTKEFRLHVSEMVSELSLAPLTCELELFIALFPPDKRKRDIDNYIKQTFDALQHAGVIEDDSQITKLTVIKQPPVKGGKCNVVIYWGGSSGN